MRQRNKFCHAMLYRLSTAGERKGKGKREEKGKPSGIHQYFDSGTNN